MSFSLLASIFQGKLVLKAHETCIHYFQSFSFHHHVVRAGGPRESGCLVG